MCYGHFFLCTDCILMSHTLQSFFSYYGMRCLANSFVIPDHWNHAGFQFALEPARLCRDDRKDPAEINATCNDILSPSYIHKLATTLGSEKFDEVNFYIKKIQNKLISIVEGFLFQSLSLRRTSMVQKFFLNFISNPHAPK